MYCRHCGKQIPDDSIYCLKCGGIVDIIDENIDAEDGFNENDNLCNLIKEQQDDMETETQGLEDMNFTKNSINTDKKSNKKMKILKWACISVTCVVVAIYMHNDSQYNKAIQFYEDGEYYKAGEVAESVISIIIDETLEKIRFSKNVGMHYTYYKNAMIYDDTLQMANYPDALTNLLQGLMDCNKYGYDAKVEGSKKALEIFSDLYYNELSVVFGLSKSDVDSIIALNSEEMNTKINDITSEIIEIKVLEIEKEEKQQKELEEKQVKIENNNANPIQIIESEAYRDGDYMYCSGTVSNISSNNHSYVKVRITYYDDNGSVLTTDWSYAVSSEGIRAGENQQFEIMTKVDGNAPKYILEVQDYD